MTFSRMPYISTIYSIICSFYYSQTNKWRKDTKKECKIVYDTYDYQLVCPHMECSMWIWSLVNGVWMVIIFIAFKLNVKNSGAKVFLEHWMDMLEI